jgi:phospholipid-binding lipoprotein MlaA
VRDTFGVAADIYVDPVRDADGHRGYRNTAIVLRAIDQRASLLKAEDAIEAAALDKYAYIRDAYLQRRRSLIHDGNPPREKDDDSAALPFDNQQLVESLEPTWNFMLVGDELDQRVELPAERGVPEEVASVSN